MKIRGTDIMIVGSFILLLIVVITPKERLSNVAIPFIIVEIIIAFYFVFRSHNKSVSEV